MSLHMLKAADVSTGRRRQKKGHAEQRGDKPREWCDDIRCVDNYGAIYMRVRTSIRQSPSRRVAKASEAPQDTRNGAAQRNRSCARASRGNSIALGSAHPCARCSLSLSKSPSSLPLIKGLVSRRGHAEYRGAQLPRYIRLTSPPGSFRSFTLGE